MARIAASASAAARVPGAVFDNSKLPSAAPAEAVGETADAPAQRPRLGPAPGRRSLPPTVPPGKNWVQSLRSHPLGQAAGYALLLAGIIMIPLPGPGTPIVLLGLAVLSCRNRWAWEWLQRTRAFLKRWVFRGRYARDLRRIERSIGIDQIAGPPPD
jgi:hypothetical protein